MLKRILNSPVFNAWFSNAIVLINSIFIIPIVIVKLSTEELNVWFLIFTVITFSQGVLFGFNGTFMRFIAYSFSGVPVDSFRTIKNKTSLEYTEFNKAEFSNIVSLMKSVYKVLSLLFFILLIIIGMFFMQKPIEALPNATEGWTTWGFVICSATITLYLSHYQLILEGMNKVALVHRVLGIVNFFGFFVILSVLLLHLTLFSVVAAYQFVSLASFGVLVYCCRKNCKEADVSFAPFSFDKNLFVLVWESAWKSGITSILANVVKHISSIIIANFFTSAQSASFQFTKRLFDVIERFTMVTFQAKLPLITKLRGRGDFGTLMPELRKTQLLAYGVFLGGYSSLIFLGEPILTLISSNVKLGSFGLLVLFSFSTFLSRWGGMASYISNQGNYVVEHILSTLMFSVFSLCVFALYKAMGIDVFPFAQVIAMLVVMPVTAKLVYKTLHTDFLSYEKRVMFPAAAVLIAVNIIYFIINS